MGDSRLFGIVLGGILAAFLMVSPTFSLVLDIHPSVSTESIYVGDVFDYVLQVSSDVPIDIETPAFDSLLTQFKVRNLAESVVSKNGKTMHVYRLSLTTYDTENVHIPAFLLAFSYKGKSHSYRVHRFDIPIQSLLVATKNVGVRPLKPVFTVAYNWLRFLGILGLVGAGLGVVYWGIQFWRRRLRAQDTQVAFVDTRPILVICQERLDRLEQVGLIEKGEIKPHFDELADILKTYLHRQYNRRILEMTTDETLAFLSEDLNEQTVRRVKAILEVCDMAKFAPLHPKEIESMDSLHKCRDVLCEIDKMFNERNTVVSASNGSTDQPDKTLDKKPDKKPNKERK